MAKPTQAPRHIAIETPLGEDVLLLQSFSGHEEISHLFEFDLDLLSEDYDINFDDIIGQNVTIRLDLPDGTRYWNGFISRFMKSGSSSARFAQYRATIVPWLWFLTRTSDCRIFQKKTVPDIIKQVFSDLGFTDIEERLTGSYRAWTYCVQYRETDFNFVSRLMEQEGICYYFLHENGKHTLVFCDSLSAFEPFPDYEEIGYSSKATSDQERISQWQAEKFHHAGKFTHTDYNFEKPTTSLLSLETLQPPCAKGEYEIFDFPGEFAEKADGEQYAKVRMEELARSYEECNGETDSRGICPGHLFTMVVRDNSDRAMKDQAREYLVVSANYQAAVEDYETSGGAEDEYGCSFTAIPSTVQFRPERITPKPIVEGTQTAVVTGPSGEEIYTDKHGRVKIQFHWDREGQYDQNSSCWIRVSQVHAGKGFGGIDIPRIGEEVIVSFIEGDPDRPIITGRVYNAESMPPFGLPGKKVVSGMKSNSTPGGGGYNEITLDDTKGKEGLTIHAQYNMDTTVENDQSTTVHNNRAVTVDVNHTETVGSNQNVSIGADQTIDVGANQNVTIGSDRTLKIGSNDTIGVGSNLSEDVGSNHSLTVGGSQKISVTGAIEISSDTSITLTVGGSTVKIEPAAVSIKSVAVTTEGSAKVESKGGLVISEAMGINEIKGATIKLN